ncbi:D-alanyl-D-alanine carboxypeptidase family protein [Methylacidiphilum kamchatkense]|uniref:D-alanyl-D-alanine carboxypeptidase (Penicillin-binding protein 5/6) n=1 Tax=Methylacidiphilum kamchatkense Kam1 TaxID=1202785 RepID=A0A516TNH7_9BACT|nr:serine hydrolase [Methylacidiphilum kamchatkense]QDQ42791.1 D-alanyl-D-alanine carboxypeptidase (penicillin-binding protein 5/6) [Methylacidiphilum kamchatkense Kam1]
MKNKNRLKLKLLFYVLFWAIPLLRSAMGEEAGFIEKNLQARAALVWDVDQKKDLFSRDADSQYYPASTTKIMTALITYEKTKLEGTVTIQSGDLGLSECPVVRFLPGEKYSVKSLLYAMLLSSSNEAAMALARHSGGTVMAFVDEMNKKARTLGCLHTHFQNPHGISYPGHMTCANDLRKIFEAFLAVPDLVKIAASPNYELLTVDGKPIQYLMSTNKLLDLYQGMVAGKTGWTPESRNTFVGLCQRKDKKLIIVILDSPNKWHDALVLLQPFLGGPLP